MKYFFMLFLSIVSSLTFAQREAYSFVYGNCEPALNNCEGANGTAVIRFNDDSIISVDRLNFHSSFQVISTCISNKEGRLLMASNQKYVYDSSGTVIIDFLANDTIDSLLSYRQSIYFLKLDDQSEVYYLLNNKTIKIDPPAENSLLNNRVERFYLSKIRVNESGFQLLSTDTLLRNDTLLGGGMHACRHANGRDWWIFKGSFNQKKYLRGLLTPNSLEFELYEGPGPDIFQNSCRLQFSSDGSKLFHYMTTYIRKMHIYDFDRCTGELSNFREIDFSPFIPYPPYDFNPFVLSPDGSKIYMGRSNASYNNYETIQVEAESGEMSIVADSVYVPLLTPNLKWVMSAFQDVVFTSIDDLSILQQPNNNASSVNRKILSNCLEVNGAIQEPIEYANHRLGPIDGSSCDTLGLDQDYTWLAKVPDVNFVLYPNPGQNELNFRTDMPLPIHLTITDAQGKLLLQQDFNKNNFTLSSEITVMPQGIYFVELRNIEKAIRASRKWMKMSY